MATNEGTTDAAQANRLAAGKLRDAANEIDGKRRATEWIGELYAGLLSEGIPRDMAESLAQEAWRGVTTGRVSLNAF